MATKSMWDRKTGKYIVDVGMEFKMQQNYEDVWYPIFRRSVFELWL